MAGFFEDLLNVDEYTDTIASRLISASGWDRGHGAFGSVASGLEIDH